MNFIFHEFLVFKTVKDYHLLIHEALGKSRFIKNKTILNNDSAIILYSTTINA